MNINRRNLFKGAGAFLGAASAYKVSEAGVLLPHDKIITAPTPPWAGETMVLAFEGAVNSFSINADIEYRGASFDGRVLGEPIQTQFNFDMEFYGNNIPDMSLIALRHRIYVQIFQRMD